MTTSQTTKPAGERLTAIRKERGLSKTAFAKLINCSRSAVSLYERGKRVPDGPRSWRLYELTLLWGDPIRPPDWEKCA